MTSGMWGSGLGEPTGESAGPVRGGGAGEHAARTGSARPVIAAASLMLSLLCVFLAFVAGVANGLLVLATVFAAVYMWAVGVFSREYWDEAVIEVRERTER